MDLTPGGTSLLVLDSENQITLYDRDVQPVLRQKVDHSIRQIKASSSGSHIGIIGLDAQIYFIDESGRFSFKIRAPFRAEAMGMDTAEEHINQLRAWAKNRARPATQQFQYIKIELLNYSTAFLWVSISSPVENSRFFPEGWHNCRISTGASFIKR